MSKEKKSETKQEKQRTKDASSIRSNYNKSDEKHFLIIDAYSLITKLGILSYGLDQETLFFPFRVYFSLSYKVRKKRKKLRKIARTGHFFFFAFEDA